ncbi:MAG: hypothetical protein AB7E95_07035 [Kiritimatiellales bacterium]
MKYAKCVLILMLSLAALTAPAESIVYSKIDGAILRIDSDLIKYSDSYIGGQTLLENPNWDVVDIGYGADLKTLVPHEDVETYEDTVYDVETGDSLLDESGNPLTQAVTYTNAWTETIIHTNISQVSDFRTKEQFLQDLKSPDLTALEDELFQWLETNGLISTNTTALSSGTDAMVMMWLRAQAAADPTNAPVRLVEYLDMKTGIQSLGGSVDKARR